MPTLLEASIPVYHFQERHSRVISAEPPIVWTVLSGLTMDQLTITKPLVSLRHLGNRQDWTARPLFTDGPMKMLVTQAPEYAIGVSIARPWERTPNRIEVSSMEDFIAFDEAGWVKYATDFHVSSGAAGTTLSTETRGYSTDRATRRKFALYWAAIRPGSGAIRRDMLRSVDRLSRQQ